MFGTVRLPLETPILNGKLPENSILVLIIPFSKDCWQVAWRYLEIEEIDILVGGGDRAIPSYFGTNPPMANLGEVKTQGYEIELRVNKVFANQLRLWAI